MWVGRRAHLWESVKLFAWLQQFKLFLSTLQPCYACTGFRALAFVCCGCLATEMCYRLWQAQSCQLRRRLFSCSTEQSCSYRHVHVYVPYVCLSHSRYCVQVCARKTKRNERKHFYISSVHSAKIFTMRRRAKIQRAAAASVAAAAALLEQGMHAERGGVLRGIIWARQDSAKHAVTVKPSQQTVRRRALSWVIAFAIVNQLHAQTHTHTNTLAHALWKLYCES